MSHNPQLMSFYASISPQTLIVTFPFVTLRILKPTVGIISSLKLPLYKENILLDEGIHFKVLISHEY